MFEYGLYKEQREGIIAELTLLFKGLSPEAINHLIEVTREQLILESTDERSRDLNLLFIRQMKILRDRKCPSKLIEAFGFRRAKVIDKALEMKMGEKNIPFLPVIILEDMGIHALMQMVKYGDKTGVAELNPCAIKNVDTIEKRLSSYFIFDVEDGQDTIGKPENEMENFIKKQNRFCLTCADIVSLGIYTNVLHDHSVYAAGSRHYSEEVPGLTLEYNRPIIKSTLNLRDIKNWGTPSYSDIFV